MTLRDLLEGPISQALELLPVRMTSPEALVMLLAIGLQESRFQHRRQIGGPARGFWQFEQGGGVRGVLRFHLPIVSDVAAGLCAVRGKSADSSTVYAALEYDDVLAAGFARLLLFTDPVRLPVLGDVHAAWDLYLRVWRPGKPHRRTWDALYAQALEAVQEYAE